jgi:hypothetical protein
MTHDLRFGWLAESRRAALHTLLAGQVDDWARDWWIGAAEGAVEVHADDHEAGHDKRNVPLLSSTESGALAVYTGGKDFDAIGRFLAGVGADVDNEPAQRIGEDALVDLAARIQRRAGVNKTIPLIRESASLGVEQPRLGAFRVIATIGRLQLGLAIDRGMADRLVPPSVTTKSAGLVPRQAAIQQAPLKVLAMMDFGSVDLAHLSDLNVGEILVGDRKLDEALQIHLEGHGVIATAYLRRSGEQRAVMLDGIHQQERP